MKAETFSTRTVVTTHSAPSLQKKLCRHFAHKVPTTLTGNTGIIDFPFGRSLVTAREDSLAIVVSLHDTEAFDKAEKVLGEHLQRMSPKEEFGIRWMRNISPTNEQPPQEQ